MGWLPYISTPLILNVVHQHVYMHQHIAHPPGPEPSPSLIDNISDTLLNAFARVKKPDERFLDMREGVDKFEDGLNHTERLYTRIRNRTSGKSHPIVPALHLRGLRLNEMETLNPAKISLQITTTWLSPFRV